MVWKMFQQDQLFMHQAIKIFMISLTAFMQTLNTV